MLEIIKFGFTVGLGVMAGLSVMLIGFIIIGVLGWAGVYIHDTIQDRRYRKRLQRDFEDKLEENENHAEED
jgi:hypothetical protein